MRASSYDAGRSTDFSRPAWIRLGTPSWGYAPRRSRQRERGALCLLSLEAAVRSAHRAPQWTAAVPLARGAVRAAAHELRLLAECLSEAAAPAPQGVALAKQLVRDPNSPLYAPGDHHALRAAARIAHRALDCPAHTTEYAQ